MDANSQLLSIFINAKIWFIFLTVIRMFELNVWNGQIIFHLKKSPGYGNDCENDMVTLKDSIARSKLYIQNWKINCICLALQCISPYNAPYSLCPVVKKSVNLTERRKKICWHKLRLHLNKSLKYFARKWNQKTERTWIAQIVKKSERWDDKREKLWKTLIRVNLEYCLAYRCTVVALRSYDF